MASTEQVHPSGAQAGEGWWLQVIPVCRTQCLRSVRDAQGIEGPVLSMGPYLSPFYSPLIDPHHHYWPFSPALLILAGPLGFRIPALLLPQSLLPGVLS